MRTLWRPTETTLLHRYAKDGRSASQIAFYLGRSRSSVVGKCHRLGIKLKGKSGRENYTKAEIDAMIRMRKEGKPARLIAPAIGRSLCSVEKKFAKLGEAGRR